MVGGDAFDVAADQAFQETGAATADWRVHAHRRANPLVDVVRQEAVVRASLTGDVDAAAAPAEDGFQAVGRGQMEDVHLAAAVPGQRAHTVDGLHLAHRGTAVQVSTGVGPAGGL